MSLITQEMYYAIDSRRLENLETMRQCCKECGDRIESLGFRWRPDGLVHSVCAEKQELLVAAKKVLNELKNGTHDAGTVGMKMLATAVRQAEPEGRTP